MKCQIFRLSFFLISFLCCTVEAEGQSSSVGFVENLGQVHDQNYQRRSDILFSYQSGGMMMFLRNDGMSYQLSRSVSSINQDKTREELVNVLKDSMQYHRIDVTLLGTKEKINVWKENRLQSFYNFYLASCPEGILKVPSFREVTLMDIYEGIDMKWYVADNELKYDFLVHANADFQRIQMKIEGADEVYVDGAGNLVMAGPIGKVIEAAPVVFQANRRLKARWVLKGNIASIDVKRFRSGQALIIDPLVRSWGTYFGSLHWEKIQESVMDDSGNVFMGGSTSSSQYMATSGAYQAVYGGQRDLFVSKFNSDGDLKWSTYYGGTGTEGEGNLAKDGFYNVYISGYTLSDSAMASPGAHQDSLAGQSDAILVKLDGSGARIWATYFGGKSGERGLDCVTDGAANVYLVGNTSSTSGIASSGSHQTSLNGILDGYIAKFNSNGTLLWSTYFGGNADDQVYSCATDFYANLYITGITSSTNGLSTTGSHQISLGGGFDSFVAKFYPAGNMHWSSFYGGTGNEQGNFCLTDNSANLYVAGETTSSNNIASIGAHQSSFGGGTNEDAFLLKMDSSGQRQWATYYGTDSVDKGFGMGLDLSQNILLTGLTLSKDSIATDSSYQTTIGSGGNHLGDAFLVQFNSSGTRQWATYYGGNGHDFGLSCFVSTPYNEIFLTGQSDSWNYSSIATYGSHQYVRGGWSDAFLVKFIQCDHAYDTIFPKSCTVFHSPAGNFYDSSGVYIETLEKEDGCDSVLTIMLTVNSIDNTVLQNNDTLTANAKWISYQWADCDSNFKVLPGDTNVQFIADRNGSFAVVLKDDSCTDTSACYTITGVGIPERRQDQFVKIYPNPNTGTFTLSLSEYPSSLQFRIFNILGEEISFSTERTNDNWQIEMPESTPHGVYYLVLKTDQEVWTERIIVQ